jgi:tRNA (guanine37-N1)-methyltransferase
VADSPVIRFHVLTLFPGMFSGPTSESIIARAQEKGLVEINLYDIRDYTHDRHRSVDDYPFGGGYGMVMKPEPVFEAVESLRVESVLDEDTPIILLTPQGRALTQRVVEELGEKSEFVLICGRYEGVDERIRQHLATDEISLGDFVLSGGEIAAMALIDAVTRLVPGVLGSIESAMDDSFTTGLLQYPQYTRPSEFREWGVPDVLLSGNHAEIARWRRQESLRRTKERRPDLLDSAPLTDEDRQHLDSI